jgi:hypothetical protein
MLDKHISQAYIKAMNRKNQQQNINLREGSPPMPTKEKKHDQDFIPEVINALDASRTVIAIKPYNANPLDEYLMVVLCYFCGQYVTWTLNVETNGCGNGHYFDTLKEALADFDKR